MLFAEGILPVFMKKQKYSHKWDKNENDIKDALLQNFLVRWFKIEGCNDPITLEILMHWK